MPTEDNASYSVLRSLFSPIAKVISYIGQATGLHRLPTAKITVFGIIFGFLTFNATVNLAPNAEALGTIDDMAYENYLIDEFSFVQKYGQGTEDPKQITMYTVADGDTISSIAAQFNLTVTTIKGTNNQTSDTLTPGQQLRIFNMDGLTYVVAKGDNVEKIGKKFGTSAEIISWYNSLTDGVIHSGDELFIPGGMKQVERDRAIRESGGRSGGYVSPGESADLGGGTLGSPVRDYVFIRGMANGHMGWDMANKTGTPIYAACSGTVTKASSGTYGGGYGTHIILNCGGGLSTLYAHLSAVSVENGQYVNSGDNIGLMGSTGRSTGPHLHFEVMLDGIKKNPKNFL